MSNFRYIGISNFSDLSYWTRFAPPSTASSCTIYAATVNETFRGLILVFVCVLHIKPFALCPLTSSTPKARPDPSSSGDTNPCRQELRWYTYRLSKPHRIYLSFFVCIEARPAASVRPPCLNYLSIRRYRIASYRTCDPRSMAIASGSRRSQTWATGLVLRSIKVAVSKAMLVAFSKTLARNVVGDQRCPGARLGGGVRLPSCMAVFSRP